MRFRAFTVTPERVRRAGSRIRRRQRRSAPAPPRRRQRYPRATRCSAAPTTRPRRRPPCHAGRRRHGAAGGLHRFPRERMPAHAMPKTPLPAGLTFDDALRRRRRARRALMSSARRVHRLPHGQRQPVTVGVDRARTSRTSARRTTIARGLFPNDTQHLARWIKNARAMKPGVHHADARQGRVRSRSPRRRVRATGLTDQQIADIVAYLQALK